MLITLERCIAGDDTNPLAKLRRDILSLIPNEVGKHHAIKIEVFHAEAFI